MIVAIAALITWGLVTLLLKLGRPGSNLGINLAGIVWLAFVFFLLVGAYPILFSH